MILGFLVILTVWCEPLSFLETPEELLVSTEDMLAILAGEEQTATMLKTALTEFCERAMAVYDEEISNSEGTVNDFQQNVNRDSPQLATLAKQIVYKEKELDGYSKELDSSSKQRKEQHMLWEAEDAQYGDSLESVIGASKVIAQLKYSEVDLEDARKDVLLALEELQDSQFLALTEIIRNGNDVNDIVDVLEQLKTQLIVAKQKDTMAENNAQQAFENYKQNLKLSIETAKKDLMNLRDKKNRIQSAVDTSQAIVFKEQGSLQAVTELRELQNVLCNDWQDAMTRKNEKREALKELMKEIENISQ